MTTDQKLIDVAKALRAAKGKAKAKAWDDLPIEERNRWLGLAAAAVRRSHTDVEMLRMDVDQLRKDVKALRNAAQPLPPGLLADVAEAQRRTTEAFRLLDDNAESLGWNWAVTLVLIALVGVLAWIK